MRLIPTPTEAFALREAGLLRSDELPHVAANWLVDDDGKALRALAGTERTDLWSVDRLWPRVLAELGIKGASPEASWQQILGYYRRGLVGGEISLETTIADLARYYEATDYPLWAVEAAQCYGAMDELAGDWGRARHAILTDVEDTLRLGQIDRPPRR